MATATQSQPQPPQFTVINRVASIPLVSDSLSALNATLLNNYFTKTPYSAAQAIGTKAYQISEPIQVRLAPVITRADGLANMTLDVVESRYPYPFKTPTGEMYDDVKQSTSHAYAVTHKTFDDRVVSPAYGLAQGVDKRFAPVVDQYEVLVNKFNGKAPDANGEASSDVDVSKDQFQLQRALRLSLDLKDQIFVYTTDQFKQVQEHNKGVQRATIAAQNVSNALSVQYGVASQKIHTLSDTMVAELQSLQKTAAQLPSQAQAGLSGLSERVGTVAGEVSNILRSDAPLGDKVARLREAVEQQVQPLLAGATAKVNGAMNAVRRKSEATKPDAQQTSNGIANGAAVNGNGAAH